MVKFKDFPLEECADAAEKVIATGGNVHQKFTCQKCGSRQTMETPNKFFIEGKCEECGHLTDIRRSGCNYMTIRLRPRINH